MKYVLCLVFLFTTWILGVAVWVAPLVNFTWLLVKDVTLFSWWYVLWIALSLLVAIIGFVITRIAID